MKLVSKFLNFLMLCIMFCITTIAEWGVYNLVALPAEESSIAIVGNDENVAYTDTFKFIADDLKESVSREPRYMVRSWFKWDWWKNGMRWADVAVEAVTGAVVPVVSPMYEVSEIKYYYTSYSKVQMENKKPTTIIGGTYSAYGIVALSDYINEPVDTTKTAPAWDTYTIKSDFEDYDNIFVYYEYTVDDPSYGSYVAGGYLYKITNNDLSTKNSVASWTVEISKDGSTLYYYPSGSWISKENNKKFINLVMKINKYNNPDRSYDTWINKFYNNDKNTIKTSVVALYFQFYMAVIISIWFLRQNPIRLTRSDDGSNEVHGGLRFHFKRHKKKEKDGGK